MAVRLTVVVSDFAATYHMGATVETRARTFDLPPDAVAFIERELKDGNCSILLALEKEPQP